MPLPPRRDARRCCLPATKMPRPRPTAACACACGALQVMGAGHEVPMFKPVPAFAMVRRFQLGVPL